MGPDMTEHEQVWAVSMMKDEEDLAYEVVVHLAEEGCDGIIVADNCSTDRTREMLDKAHEALAGSPCQVIVVDDPEVGYYQSRKMSELAAMARYAGADWIVPFDADEVWYAETRLADFLRGLAPNVGVVEATMWNHYRTGLDGPELEPFESMVWRHPEKGALPKVAFRSENGAVIRQGNHGVDGVSGYRVDGLQIRHFPYRSWEHFRRKAINGALAYADTDLPDDQGAHWRGYGQILERHGDDALREVYDRYFHFLSPVNEGMLLDPAPYRRFRS